MMPRLLMVGVSALLVGCATTAPQAPVREEVPVAVGCLGDAPARPVSRYGVGPWPGDKAAAQAALGDAIAWEKYATGLEVAMAGCAKKGDRLTPPSPGAAASAGRTQPFPAAAVPPP